MTEENHNSHDFPDSVVSKKIGDWSTSQCWKSPSISASPGTIGCGDKMIRISLQPTGSVYFYNKLQINQ